MESVYEGVTTGGVAPRPFTKHFLHSHHGHTLVPVLQADWFAIALASCGLSALFRTVKGLQTPWY